MLRGDALIDLSQLTTHHWLQVEMAAKGCVSGTLAEWPSLAQALRLAGIPHNLAMRGAEMRAICQRMLTLKNNPTKKEPHA